MAQNLASPDSHEIPLTVLGGQVTFIDPTSLPQGVSPDCPDMQFNPGSAFSRDGFKKVFSAPLYPTATRTYGKSYVDPTGIIRNLYFYSNGALTVENITVSPGVETLLAQTAAPGAWAKSCTAFGREYIAISDTLHGTEVPLQYDGINLDRVTQDGPGSSPEVSSFVIPAVDLTTGTGTITLAVDEVDPENPDPISGFFTSINLYTTSALTGVEVGQFVTISGTANYNGTAGPITAIFPSTPRSLIEIANYIPAGTNCEAVAPNGSCTLLGSPGSMVVSTGPLQRNNNIVSGITASPHQLQPGYQVQISNAQASQVGDSVQTPSDTTIVIDNENAPGIATVTVGLASGQTSHGLIPGCNVAIFAVKPATVGTSISSIVRAAQVVTVVMSASTGLNPDAIVTISGVTPESFNGIWQVINVTTTTNPGDTFTYAQVDVDVAGSGGSTAINWPVPATATPTYFEVIAAPTPTTFQVAVSYADGTWTSGSVTFPWDGTFFVKSVFSPATPGGTDYEGFSYQQYGPNATAVAVSGSIVATPYGQASPGQHQMQAFFITRSGYLTKPSPPVTFIANGGQYLRVTNIPIGPSSVVARGIAFTGAEGAYFFYISTQPQENGQLVGTATQINDNTTTNAIFDFGDPTLFGTQGTGGAISFPGNNLANGTILGGALGFAQYGSRLITYGQRNSIQNLLNPGFDGGYLPNVPTIPTGWDATLNSGGAITEAGHFGEGWLISVTSGAACGELQQSAYEDYSGSPILTGNTQYKVRAYLKPSVAAADLTFTVSFLSASTSFSSSASVSGAQMSANGSFVEASFSLVTPVAIPSDMLLDIQAATSASTVTLLVDDLSLIFSETPYLNTLFGSYVGNPEAFDGVSGKFGPSDDTHQPLDLGVIRSNLYILTQDPGGRLHQTSQGSTEPSGWVVDEVGQNCGTVSTFSLTVSQANDNTGGGGEEWFAWYSSSGPRIFGGEFPFKIAQEITRRKGRVAPGSPDDLTNINPLAQTTVWSLNDPEQKIMYFGVPMNAATAPSTIWMLNYLGCETAEEIANANPVHRAVNSGKMIANDLGRKWSPWHRTMNGAALMFREEGYLEPVFFGGNGLIPNTSAVSAFGNAYSLDPSLLTDDDYGLIVPYYTTYAFPDSDLAQALGIGGGLKMCSYAYGLISGTGTMTLSVLYNLLSKVWRINQPFTMQENPDNDTEWGCGQATGKRFWFKFASTPTSGTDNGFELNNWTVAIKKNARMPVRGSNR